MNNFHCNNEQTMKPAFDHRRRVAHDGGMSVECDLVFAHQKHTIANRRFLVGHLFDLVVQSCEQIVTGECLAGGGAENMDFRFS